METLFSGGTFQGLTGYFPGAVQGPVLKTFEMCRGWGIPGWPHSRGKDLL